MQAGYCTNVHAGANLQQTRSNLEKHALEVKSSFSPNEPIGVGLWLSNATARTMLTDKLVGEWRDWLASSGLVPFTMNAFPFGDFHADRVLHDVYLPTWMQRERVEYTRDIITILDGLLPKGMNGTISTLPIAWGTPALSPEALTQAATNLRRVARFLGELEYRSGRHVRLCLEPEPGCVLQRATDIVNFFTDYLRIEDEKLVNRYLGVCHDVCHSAVMFEPQTEAIRAYHNAGITIGKVQISSAVAMKNQAGVEQLRQFAEERYLHQTVKKLPNGETQFFENLPDALSDTTEAIEWRTHFHVPIYLGSFGELSTTQSEIVECLKALKAIGEVPHFEVETYAWGVLPKEIQQPTLAAGISEELRFFADVRKNIETKL